MATLDDLLTAGGRTFKFERPGDTVTGVITSIDVRQARDYDTGKPETWDDGNPKEQIVVTLTTDLRDATVEDDDGSRTVYIKGWGAQLRAFREAVKQAGDKPQPGDTFTASYTGDGPKVDRKNPPKLYEYRIVKATGLDALAGTPTPTTVAASAAGAVVETPADKVRQLISVGLDDAEIARAVGLDPAVVAAIRAA